MTVLYEDNHLIIVNKQAGEIVQGDKTGDTPLSDIVKEWLKEKHSKPGNVYLGVVHRLDRPVSGVVLFAKTSKALPRLNKMFAGHENVSGESVNCARGYDEYSDFWPQRQRQGHPGRSSHGKVRHCPH